MTKEIVTTIILKLKLNVFTRVENVKLLKYCIITVLFIPYFAHSVELSLFIEFTLHVS